MLKTQSFAKLLQLLITRISSPVDSITSHLCSCFFWRFLCFRLVVWFIIKLLQLSKVVLIALIRCVLRMVTLSCRMDINLRMADVASSFSPAHCQSSSRMQRDGLSIVECLPVVLSHFVFHNSVGIVLLPSDKLSSSKFFVFVVLLFDVLTHVIFN